MAQAISRQFLTAEALTQSQACACGICGRQSNACLGFPLAVTFHQSSKLLLSVITDAV